MITPCTTPVAFDALIAYYMAELSETEAERIEEHYFSCAYCSGRLEVLAQFEQGVRSLVHGGAIMVSGTMAMVGRARGQNIVVREYRTDPGEHVQCTAAPQDELLVTRYGGLGGVVAVDVHFRGTIVGTDQTIRMELADAPVDQHTGDLVLIAPAALNRSFPALEIEVTLTVHSTTGDHEQGPYYYHHRPWAALDADERRQRAGR